MKKIVLIAIFWLVGVMNPLMAQSQTDAILSIDTGGHTAMINDIITTKSGDIISASDDKTIRVWSKEGREKRKILGQIGAGSEGKIFPIALSPDEHYLAVGGFLDKPGDHPVGQIRLYDYATGKLISLLKSHTNVVNDLCFSPDGRTLASGSGDTTVKLWDMKRLALATTINFHTNHVYAVTFASNDTIISAGLDNRIALHTLEGRKISEYTHSQKLHYIATNQTHIATCGVGKTIVIFDKNLQFRTTIQSETVSKGLAYSPNGRYLLAGRGSQPNHVNIYDSHNHYTRIATFDKHTNLTQAVAWLDDETAVSGGGDNNEIYIWDRKTQQIQTNIVGAGQRIWSVGLEGERIAWGNVFDYTNHNNRGEFQKSFNLQTLAIAGIKDGAKTPLSNFNRINSDGLSHSAGGEYGKADAVLTIASTGASITKDATTGYRHRCYGWYNDTIISGGANGHLKVYDKHGKEVASLIGHTGGIWSIALEGDRLVSGSSDQTIKVWDLKPLKNGNKKLKIYPLLTLFVGSDNEWVMWTPEGYFNASKNGAKYVGYHINQGSNKEAKFIRIDKFNKALYRPDLIKKALNPQ